jgi:hypothetical protein
MSAPPDTTKALRDLEALLQSAPQGGLDPVVVEERTREVLQLLKDEEPHWLDAAEAKCLLGIELEHAVKAWAQHGVLRSRTLPNGCLQVRLDDVLRERVLREDLMAMPGEELTPEELRIMKGTRPGKNPWEREQAKPSP